MGTLKSPHLISTISHKRYPFNRIEEFSDEGESLEVSITGIKSAKIRPSKHLWERYKEFLPFSHMDERYSLGEGNTPLIKGNKELQRFTGINNLLIKDESQNPTWSFKDRGSLACIFMAKEMGEDITATISTGNMGHSIAAYGARAGIKVVVFVPELTPIEKIKSMVIHGANVIKVRADDYSSMKKDILKIGKELNLRIVSGNGPIRVEGYKLTAFEINEQLKGVVPDYIAVPTSACGHIRGIFKGYRELKFAGIIDKLPKMIIVQAKNNSPIVSGIKKGSKEVIPFSNFHTIAKAIAAGNPRGGNEIIHKAREYGWLAEDVTEEEILKSQRKIGEIGHFVEPASATSLYAIKKLREKGKISEDETVVMMLTGSGMKDFGVFNKYDFDIKSSNMDRIKLDLQDLLF